MRAKLRRITIDGVVYRWIVSHVHDRAPGGGRDKACSERFVAYLDRKKASPLRVVFRDGPHRRAGYPSSGIVWTPDAEANLNAPSVVARVIRRALSDGWTPNEARTAFVVADGFVFLGLDRAVDDDEDP